MSQTEIRPCDRCETPLEGEKIKELSEAMQELSMPTQKYLGMTHYDLLCQNCLHELDELAQKASQSPLPPQETRFEEGLHFYRDQGKFVFTEFYHILKGYCCKRNCRHCAYGFRKR